MAASDGRRAPPRPWCRAARARAVRGSRRRPSWRRRRTATSRGSEPRRRGPGTAGPLSLGGREELVRRHALLTGTAVIVDLLRAWAHASGEPWRTEVRPRTRQAGRGSSNYAEPSRKQGSRVDAVRAVPARLEHARSTVELGAALRRAQRRTEARAELAAGMELADRCGAQRLLSRAREELGAAGGRPRRIATTGLAALTASEQRVAAEGASDPEIAQELCVARRPPRRTSHTCAKLGISGGCPRAPQQALGEGAGSR